MGAALIAAMVGLSVALLVVAPFRSNRLATARQRVARLAPEADGDDPLASSFAHRIVQPLVSRATGAMMIILPARITGAARRQLEMAGGPLSLRAFLMIWLACGLVLPLVTLLLLIVGQQTLGRLTVLAFVAAVVLGTYLPWLLLRRRARARAQAIEKRLPDAMDLLITSIEAGLGLQAALLSVSERMNGPVAEEFGRTVREVSLGRERTEVFELMAERSGVPDMRLFARAVAQAERTGFPIAQILRNHASEIRDRRRQIVREKAAKVPVKIILPTALFVFPTLFMVILGPIVLYALELFG